MRLSLALIALVSASSVAVTAAPAAPLTSSHLVIRGQHWDHFVEHVDNAKCTLEKGLERIGCRVANKLADHKLELRRWELGVKADFEDVREYLRREVREFDRRYDDFKVRAEAWLKRREYGAEVVFRTAEVDVVLHLALFWEFMAQLDEDVRQKLWEKYAKLADEFSLKVHRGHYKYRREEQLCEQVLVDTLTYWNTYRLHISVADHWETLTEIHEVLATQITTYLDGVPVSATTSTTRFDEAEIETGSSASDDGLSHVVAHGLNGPIDISYPPYYKPSSV